MTSKERQIGSPLISPVLSRSLTSGSPDCWVHARILMGDDLAVKVALTSGVRG